MVCIFSLLIRGSFEVEPSNPEDFLAKQNLCTLLTWTVAPNHQSELGLVDDGHRALGECSICYLGVQPTWAVTKAYVFCIFTAEYLLPLSIASREIHCVTPSMPQCIPCFCFII